MPATSAGLPRVSFFSSRLFLLLRPLTVLMKQTRQAVRAINQSIFLDVYGQANSTGMPPDQICKQSRVTNLLLYKHCTKHNRVYLNFFQFPSLKTVSSNFPRLAASTWATTSASPLTASPPRPARSSGYGFNVS